MRAKDWRRDCRDSGGLNYLAGAELVIAFASSEQRSQGRVLVVDDEPAILSVLNRALTRFGWEVDAAHDGLEALRLLERPASEYQAVVCDLSMPGMSGQQLHKWALDRRPDVIPRLIFTSGNVEAEHVADFLLNAGCAVLPKPFDLSALRAMVAHVARAEAAEVV